MLKVFKYEVRIADEFTVMMPYDAKILKVECQGKTPCMWALVNPECQNVERRFRFAGTGHPIDYEMSELEFISTFQMEFGALIFHIFEVLQK